jgi:3-oxoacyl-[acyl-carrier protein] reductase
MHGAVVISGAAGGIGKATLMRFISAGFECFAVDINCKALEELRVECGSLGSWLHCFSFDLLAELEELASLLAEVRVGARTFTLVNNLGGSRHGGVPLSRSDWKSFEETFSYNLKGFLHLSRVCAPLLRDSNAGRIVNVASVVGRTAGLDAPIDYVAAKAALIAMSRQLVREFSQYGVLINTVCPGIIATERIRRRWDSKSCEEKRETIERIPLARLGTPEEVAEAIYFLGSASNTYITGAVLDVNGGLFCP